MYSLKNLITKESLEELISDEEIFEYYLAPVNFSDRLRNPLREDEWAGCSYKISKSGNLYFVDWSTGVHYSCYKFVMDMFDISFHEAVYKIYQDLIEGNPNIIQYNKGKKKYTPSKIELKIKSRKFSKKEIDFWNIGGVKFTEEELIDYGVRSVETLWENDKIYDNLKNTFAYVEDDKISQIYMPMKSREYRRFINSNNFKLGGLNKINYEEDYLVITKSFKDNLYLRKFNINSIYTISEHITSATILSRRELDKWRESSLYTLFDNDIVGKRQTIKYKNELNTIPLLIPKNEGKDVSEHLEKFGYQYLLDEIEETKRKLL